MTLVSEFRGRPADATELGEDRVDPAGLLALAEHAAELAGRLLLNSVVADDGACSLDAAAAGIVTALDRKAEASIRETILSHRPHDWILGEELGTTAGQTGVSWIIDPIDGTVNYVAGLPGWAISIAAQVNGRTTAGVVHAPMLRTTFTALVDAGAWCNGTQLPLRDGYACELGDALVATGFATDPGRRGEQLQQLGRVLREVRDVRCHGAASLELCAVAAGDLDAYFESGLHLWDVAAGALIAATVGVDVSGSPWSGEGPLLAAPPSLAGSLRRLVDTPSMCETS